MERAARPRTKVTRQIAKLMAEEDRAGRYQEGGPEMLLSGSCKETTHHTSRPRKNLNTNAPEAELLEQSSDPGQRFPCYVVKESCYSNIAMQNQNSKTK
jgi:hypothetical protein